MDFVSFVYVIIPQLVAKVGFSSARLRTYVRVYERVCNNFAALRRDLCCSSTLVLIISCQ